jgi:hypothetical protein
VDVILLPINFEHLKGKRWQKGKIVAESLHRYHTKKKVPKKTAQTVIPSFKMKKSQKLRKKKAKKQGRYVPVYLLDRNVSEIDRRRPTLPIKKSRTQLQPIWIFT